jgi:acetylglutamate kinase
VSDIVVVKLGGTTLAEQQQVLAEVAKLARTRPIVVVHGGGKRISEWLERLGVQSRFVNGLRVTDPAALELVAALHDAGCDAVGLSGVDGGLLIGHRLPDVGLVATVTGVRRDLLDQLMVGGQVPVVAPLARDEEGVVCNVNADDAAAGLAAGLGARQLVLMTDVDGVRGADGVRLPTITPAEAEALIASGTIRGGMVPKVRAALAALAWDGAEAIIADGSAPDALVRALADPTFGTRVSATAHAGPQVGAT